MQLPTSDEGVWMNQVYRTTVKRILDAFFRRALINLSFATHVGVGNLD